MAKFMVVIIGILLLFFIIVFAANFIPANQYKVIQLEKPSIPEVKNDNNESIKVVLGSYNWQTPHSAVCADAAIPYELVDKASAYTAKPGEVLEYSFDYPPNSTSIKFWKGKEVVYSTMGKGTITAPAFEDEYTVEIFAEWKEGQGSFAFALQVVNEGNTTESQKKPETYKPSVKLPGTSMSLEAIAGRLFGQYLEHYMSHEVPEGQRLRDYRIDQVSFIKENSGSYDTEVTFSVQPVDQNSKWMAGNGIEKENNWIKSKVIYAKVTVKDDIYTLEGFKNSP